MASDDLHKHIDACPIGWHEGKVIVSRLTDHAALIEWVLKLGELGDASRAELATLKAALAESDIRIAGVEAERDHYRAGLAESERCVSCVEAERDAYRAALAELLPKCACGCFASVRTRSGKLWCTRCAVSVTGTGWGFHGAATRAALALLAGHETKDGGK